MSNLSLLKKAREILAHVQQSTIPEPKTIEATRETPLSLDPLPMGPASLPEHYCTLCGGDYWIRVTDVAAWQCGRCVPLEARVETLLSPGGSLSTGTAPRPDAPSESTDIMPAVPNARPVYWETSTGLILGPAVPEFLARGGSSYWIATTFDGQIRWINADWLRSRQAFERQVKSKVLELMEEPQ